ncbi:MAG: hypothetical protein M0R31_11235 [Candidatus Riflebacteria bacterium]|nr:hypothetical protein [Candidatus Riflebacteria bacterium]
MLKIVKNTVKIAAVAAIGFCALGWPEPAEAVLEGSNRERMEFLDFSEKMIRSGLYANTGNNSFSHDKKRFVRGVKRHNEPYIYEPDVYTWRLAMDEHRKKMEKMAPPPPVMENSGFVTPTPTVRRPDFPPSSTLPDNPMPIFNSVQPMTNYNNNALYPQQGYVVQSYVEQSLVPSGQPYVVQSSPALPGDSQETMNGMIYRARVRGIYPTDPLRGQEIRDNLREHSINLGR